MKHRYQIQDDFLSLGHCNCLRQKFYGTYSIKLHDLCHSFAIGIVTIMINCWSSCLKFIQRHLKFIQNVIKSKCIIRCIDLIIMNEHDEYGYSLLSKTDLFLTHLTPIIYVAIFQYHLHIWFLYCAADLICKGLFYIQSVFN
jgi:hypothetical protein